MKRDPAKPRRVKLPLDARANELKLLDDEWDAINARLDAGIETAFGAAMECARTAKELER